MEIVNAFCSKAMLNVRFLKNWIRSEYYSCIKMEIFGIRWDWGGGVLYLSLSESKFDLVVFIIIMEGQRSREML